MRERERPRDMLVFAKGSVCNYHRTGLIKKPSRFFQNRFKAPVLCKVRVIPFPERERERRGEMRGETIETIIRTKYILSLVRYSMPGHSLAARHSSLYYWPL